MAEQQFDYIIIGGGSAGCVIASRLIEAQAGSVLLLEAGGRDNSLFHKMPAGLVKLSPKTRWPYRTLPQQHVNKRVMQVAQGRVLGGGSSVNGMIYLRGQPQDYDDWAEEYGCRGWSFNDLLPFFRKAENNECLSGTYHAQRGPLSVSENQFRHPLTDAFVRAGQEQGLPYVNDFNDGAPAGVGLWQTTTHHGERASTSRAYLDRVKNNPQLTTITDAEVQHLILEGSHASGVVYHTHGKQQCLAYARREVILSAGAFGSAKILMLSGIGPQKHLDSVGIVTCADLPVGKYYQDHLHMSLNATVTTGNSMWGEDKGLRAVRNFAQWQFFRSGLLTSNILEGGALIDTTGSGRSDVQVHFLPVLDNFENGPGANPAGSEHGITLKVGYLPSKSRGEVRLNSSNPSDELAIDAGYLSDPADLAGQIRAVQTGLRLLRSPSLQSIVGHILHLNEVKEDDINAITNFILDDIKTVYHPIGTCRMGPYPATSVVDLKLRVHGISGLRVADCSIFPQIPSGNTNAPTIMIAERAADLILKDISSTVS
ncbi:GMC family oxidoreductase [Pantoea coffeiphila]|uniref:Glucose-methanol-choline oxidoreductase n=1 Tax=Pantoea coffeiphila TaxID=1465635 RepID=A0A2S9ID92_9GAMM|nr:FAD-dependent oxidoreductase [Pantoea coffeiphila]PRD15756.1 glucose-methanol-choline oxidoreductase [Pantoea coffeiphila]